MKKRIPHRFNENGIEEKYCNQCEQWHFVSNYNMKSASWDKLETKCKDCTKKKSAEFRKENPDYDKEYQFKNKESLKIYKKEYYNKKKISEIC